MSSHTRFSGSVPVLKTCSIGRGPTIGTPADQDNEGAKLRWDELQTVLGKATQTDKPMYLQKQQRDLFTELIGRGPESQITTDQTLMA